MNLHLPWEWIYLRLFNCNTLPGIRSAELTIIFHRITTVFSNFRRPSCIVDVPVIDNLIMQSLFCYHGSLYNALEQGKFYRTTHRESRTPFDPFTGFRDWHGSLPSLCNLLNAALFERHWDGTHRFRRGDATVISVHLSRDRAIRYALTQRSVRSSTDSMLTPTSGSTRLIARVCV